MRRLTGLGPERRMRRGPKITWVFAPYLAIAGLWSGVDGLTHRAFGREPVRSLLELREERVVVQKWDLSCGAAVIATVLNYQYGDRVSEREIAIKLFNRKKYLDNPDAVRGQEGFSLLDMKLYVDRRGYEGIGYGDMVLEQLIDNAPIIVPVNFNGYNHFVVFRGVRANRVLLADPAWGTRTVTLDEFEDGWIEYPQVGRVGFVVAHKDGSLPPNRLAPRPSDFVFLR
jgi:uncharacterized protein